MAAKAKSNSRLTEELLETAKGMRDSGVMDAATYDKITLRHLDEAETRNAAPLTGEEIRAMRERANMSQAVFARYLNLTVGYVSKLERGVESPAGAALALLNVVRRLGARALL
jgi:putative transcriptional regulator